MGHLIPAGLKYVMNLSTIITTSLNLILVFLYRLSFGDEYARRLVEFTTDIAYHTQRHEEMVRCLGLALLAIYFPCHDSTFHEFRTSASLVWGMSLRSSIP